MEFCPSCGTRLILTLSGTRASLSCRRCGFERRADSKPVTVEKVANRNLREDVVVIGRDEQRLRTTPTVKTICPKCGNNLAYTWQVQTRSGDEGTTQFFRCTKCSKTFRLYT